MSFLSPLPVQAFVPYRKAAIAHTGVAIAIVVMAVTWAGCATTRPGLGVRPLAPGAPAPQRIVRDLAENQARLRSFEAKIEFLLESPQVTGKNSGRGTLYYNRPDHLFARAVHWPSGVPVLELTVDGTAYLLWLPQDNKAYHSAEGLAFESVPFRVSPGDIVKEMFNAEAWDALPRAEIVVEAHDELTQTTTLLIGPQDAPRRRIEVAGPPWRMTRNELFGDDGALRSVTIYSDYQLDPDSQIRYPGEVEAQFPAEETLLRFSMRQLRPNTTFARGIFDIHEKLRNSRLQRHLVE